MSPPLYLHLQSHQLWYRVDVPRLGRGLPRRKPTAKESEKLGGRRRRNGSSADSADVLARLSYLVKLCNMLGRDVGSNPYEWNGLLQLNLTLLN